MRVVKIFIWLGFTALLAVSMPKIAWVFRSYEGAGAVVVQVSGVTIDILWLIPLFVALCVDVLTLALTYAVSVDRAKASQFSMWAFVALLCGLSYYCNLLYNYAHAPIGSVWSDSLVSASTPFILSGVPLFALCYTLILSRIEGKSETLEEKANRLERERGVRERIQSARQGWFTGRVMNAMSGAGDIAKHAEKMFARPGDDIAPDTRQTLDGHSNDTGPDVETIEGGYSEEGAPDIQETFNGYSNDRGPDVQKILNGHPPDTGPDTGAIEVRTFNGHSNDTAPDTEMDIQTIQEGETEHAQTRTTSRVYLSLDIASARYGYSTSYLTKLVQSGKLKTQRNDKTRILESSLLAYATKSGRKVLELPYLNFGSLLVTYAEFIWARSSKGEYTQEKIAEILGWSRDKVAKYDALKGICAEAWKVIVTTFEENVTEEKGEGVTSNVTTVTFTEGLLRSILDLSSEQQLELVQELATNKDFSKGKFKTRAENYCIRNEMKDYALEKLGKLGEPYTTQLLEEVYSGAYLVWPGQLNHRDLICL